MEARNPIQARIGKAGQAIARATRSDALAGLVGNDEQLRFVVADELHCYFKSSVRTLPRPARRDLRGREGLEVTKS